MSHVASELHSLFPHDVVALRAMKATDTHFQGLAEQFATLEGEIHRSETGQAPAMADAHIESLKRQRLALLDEIAALLEGQRP